MPEPEITITVCAVCMEWPCRRGCRIEVRKPRLVGVIKDTDHGTVALAPPGSVTIYQRKTDA